MYYIIEIRLIAEKVIICIRHALGTDANCPRTFCSPFPPRFRSLGLHAAILALYPDPLRPTGLLLASEAAGRKGREIAPKLLLSCLRES